MCGMLSATSHESLGFTSAFDAVSSIESELSAVSSIKNPTLFVLINRPSKYILLIDRCVEVERRAKIAFSMYSSDESVGSLLQDCYDRSVLYRRAIERKFAEVDTLFKGSVVLLVALFVLLSSMLERLLIVFDYRELSTRIHDIADALNHTAISFIFVGILIYVAATAYNAKRRFLS